jgi:alcohol dehydrogenase
MTLPSRFSFAAPVKIVSGIEALAHLPTEIDALGVRRPLLLCGQHLAPVQRRRLLGAFSDSDMALGLFDDLPDDLEDTTVDRIARLYRQRDRDGIVACGGGAVADTAKVLAALIGSSAQTVAELSTGTADANGGRPPTIQLLDRWVDGTETTPWVTRRPTLPVGDVTPQLAVVDTRLIGRAGRGDWLPPGLAALALAVESLLASPPNPFTAAYARCTLQSLAAHLPAACRKPSDGDAACAVANAVITAGCAAANTEAGHVGRLAMVAAGFCSATVGELMGILLPSVLRMQLGPDGGGDLDLVHPLMGADMAAVVDPNRVQALSLRALEAFTDQVHDSAGGRSSSARTLAATGIAEAQLSEIAAQASAPDRPEEAERLLEVLQQSWRDGTDEG